jgi:hypothetical protein
MPSERAARACALICASAAAWLLLGSPAASAQTTLRWTQPAGSAPVSQFRVFKGPALDAGELVYEDLPAPVAGIYSVDVQIDEIDQGLPVYVWLTATNAYGESPPSTANFYPEGCDPGADSDCDGIPNAGSPGGVPCTTGQTVGCDDNCPYTQNADQRDIGGVGSLPADGIGDVCQCGDVSGDGRITLTDFVLLQRWLSFGLPLPKEELCDVGGSPACTLSDFVVLSRVLNPPAISSITQQCDPALMP